MNFPRNRLVSGLRQNETSSNTAPKVFQFLTLGKEKNTSQLEDTLLLKQGPRITSTGTPFILEG